MFHFIFQGLSFSSRDRDSMSVRGLLPPAIRTPELEMKSVLMNLNLYSSPLAKYCYLRELSVSYQYVEISWDHLEHEQSNFYTNSLLMVVGSFYIGLTYVCIIFNCFFKSRESTNIWISWFLEATGYFLNTEVLGIVFSSRGVCLFI